MVVADREMVELEADRILAGADTEDVAFLVVGDPFGHGPLLFSGAEDRTPQPPKVVLGLSRCALACCIRVEAVPAMSQVVTHGHADC